MTRELSLERQVYFLGNVLKVERFLNSLDTFVLNSLSEGMSNTVLEAMSCGLPVVATAVGANSELVENDRTGYLIPSDDSAALAEAIARLANDRCRRERLGISARQRIEQHFGMEAMVRDYSEMYESLYSRNHRCTRCLDTAAS